MRVVPLVLVRMPLAGGGLTVVMSVTLVGLGLAVRVSGGAWLFKIGEAPMSESARYWLCPAVSRMI